MATNLPAHVASGELITSVWGNQVVDELTRQRTEVWNIFAHPGGTTTVYGVFDIGTTQLGPYSYPVRVTVLSLFAGGYGGSGTAWHGDFVRSYDNQPIASSASQYTVPARYANIHIPGTYDVPAGQPASFRTRVSFDASDAAPITFYFSAAGIFHVQRTDIT